MAQSTSALLVSKSGKTRVVFPFANVPRGQKINISLIRNPLDPKRLAKSGVRTLKDSVEELEKHPAVKAALEKLLASGKKFDINKIGQLQNQQIGRATFHEITQRLVIPTHVADIMNQCVEELLSPVFATTSPDGTLPAFDTQHGLHVVAILAKYGLWNNDATKWLEFLFPFFVIANNDPAFADEAAYHRNGKGQKKWKSYEYHKIKAAAVRRARLQNKTVTNPDYLLAEELQTLCEREEAIPMPDNHPHKGKAGTLDRVDPLYLWIERAVALDLNPLTIVEFILKTHRKYWHGEKCDSGMYGLYGNMFVEAHTMGITMSGSAWDEFLDNFHSVILECFTDLATLRTDATAAHDSWYRKNFPTLAAGKKNVKGADNCELSVVLKIYKRLGGTHPIADGNTGISFEKDTSSIYDFLDPIDVHDKVDEAINV